MPFDPLGKDDGDFDDFKPGSPEAVGHFDLKAVTVGADVIQLDGFQGATAKAFVAPGGVGKGHAGDNMDINAGAAA